MVPVVAALLLWKSRSEYSLVFVHVSMFVGASDVWVRACMGRGLKLFGWNPLQEKLGFLFTMHSFFRIGELKGNCPAKSFIRSAINLPSLSLCSFTPPAIYPSFPVAKGPCLFVALVICTNFLCNLFPSQPPTWSSRVRLLKVEALIPASPLAPITPCLFHLPKSQIFCPLKFHMGFEAT